jgi:hypothetical protein
MLEMATAIGLIAIWQWQYRRFAGQNSLLGKFANRMTRARVHANGYGVESRFSLCRRAAFPAAGWTRTDVGGLASGHHQEYANARQPE